MKIEFILCRNDNTWDTTVVKVPKEFDEAPDDEINYWFSQKYLLKPKFKNVVHAAVYCINPGNEPFKEG
jgi:hypothetical protein